MAYMHPFYLTHHMKSEEFSRYAKAFDRAWHDGLIYELQCCGIRDKLLKLIQSFLKNASSC